ncbi:MAG: excinuclease ABC subunit UvrB [Candidatus Gracilibacteria bacterium]
MLFSLISPYQPTGDQPEAIRQLVESLQVPNRYQTLQGVTGSGKTFTMANIIQKLQRPTLVIAHNKTLAAQLCQEFREFFPHNAVHYFVSYYDYYQPEAYIQKTDTYIEKDSAINDEIDRLRHAATEALLTRKDVIIIASVSCIYGIGSKEEYLGGVMHFQVGETYTLKDLIDRLVALQFERGTLEFTQGMFRVLGDTLQIFPASQEQYYSLEFFGTKLEAIRVLQPITSHVLESVPSLEIFPASHTVTSPSHVKAITPAILHELQERIKYFQEKGNIVAAERIKTRVEYDLEMMGEVGYVKGIENYSRYLDGRNPGDPPMTLIDYFPKNFLTFIDESHMTLSQIRGMFAGDKARKVMLIENGFRLPSAYDNRPLFFEEFEAKINQFVCVSATPGVSDIEQGGPMVEQIIRPTGLLDPEIAVERMDKLVESLLENIRTAVEHNERALITAVTKKSSEDLAAYLKEQGIKAHYLHSEIDTIERLKILKDLRTGVVDVIVGVNLLREGLDLPEVSFIGIVDAHKQGFLRSTQSLIQIVGRAARNSNGHVIFYSHEGIISRSMQETMDITSRRRATQIVYNTKHGITPTTIISSIKDLGFKDKTQPVEVPKGISQEAYIKRLELEMDVAAANLDFEKAAEIRDTILSISWKG